MKTMKQYYSHVLDMLLKAPDCALCAWDPTAITFESAVSKIAELTAGKSEWRAVIVQDSETHGFSCIDKRNPFDAVGAVPVLQNFGEQDIFRLLDERALLDETDKDGRQELNEQLAELIESSAESIRAFREQKRENYIQAVENPLTRLAIWLLGSPMQDAPEQPANWPIELLEGEPTVDSAYYDKLYACGVFASELEQMRLFKTKYAILSAHFQSGSLLAKKPSAVLVVSERHSRRADDIFRAVGKPHEDLEYQNFCDDNLFSEKLRFILSDVHYENNIRNPESYLEFVSFVYLLAITELPYGAMQAGRVYSGAVDMDQNKAKAFFVKYLHKLEVTKAVLKSRLARRRMVTDPAEELTAEEAIALFESDTEIPVIIRSGCKTEELYARPEIGLAKDCPHDEYDHWYSQVTEITRKFIRYLREPRRALKHAVRHDFKEKSVIEDDRIRMLNEDRLEDIDYRLLEEERKMIETTTTQLYQTKQFTDRIDKADQQVRGQIEKRMTKKRAICAGLISLGAFLFGFIPLLLGNSGTPKAISASVWVTGIAVGLLALIGLIVLFVLRHKLLKAVRGFNAVMHEILTEIENSLKAFSSYLGHACNMMRNFSVFNFLARKGDMTENIYKKHLHDVQQRIDSVKEMFAARIDLASVPVGDIRPYEYDFTQPVDYDYDIPYEDTDSTVEFDRMGCTARVPVNYLRRVTITREELYD